MRARTTLAAITLALLSACSNATDATEQFELSIEDGASCAELFEIRNSVASDDARIPEWNQQLRAIGCHSSGSTRTD